MAQSPIDRLIMIQKPSYKILAIASLILLTAIDVRAEDYEQYAAAQAKTEAEKIKLYQQEAQQFKASIEKRMQSGDIHEFAQWIRSQPQSSTSALSAKVKRYPSILVFVSFSMPKTSLQQWLVQAQKVKANLVLRGLVDNSFTVTTKRLQELFKQQPIGGFLLDPTLFQRYGITKVPAVVIHDGTECQPDQSCKENYAIFYGDTSLDFALTKIVSTEKSLAPLAEQALSTLREDQHVT